MRSPKPSRSILYANCAVYPPDADEIIFRCDAGRMNFYIDRELAEWVQKDPPVIRLKFKPAGKGHAGDPFFTSPRPNRCVACGVGSGLCRHHVVPETYRRYFPRDHERMWSYDVLALCSACHGRYEDHAHLLKLEIAKSFGVPEGGWSGYSSKYEVRFIKACYALHRHGNCIPTGRKATLEGDIKRHLGVLELPQGYLPGCLSQAREIIRNVRSIPAAEVIVGKLGDLDDFAVRWRTHFVEVMQPKFLPEHWNPKRRIYSEPDPHRRNDP